MNKTEAFWLIVVCFLITLMWRSLPFLFFGGKHQMPKLLEKLKDLLPSAIMAILLVYGLKGLSGAGGHDALAMIVASVFTAGIHLWRKNTILSVFLGTALYIVLLNFV